MRSSMFYRFQSALGSNGKTHVLRNLRSKMKGISRGAVLWGCTVSAILATEKSYAKKLLCLTQEYHLVFLYFERSHFVQIPVEV
jgi:hypothetical protein